MSMIFSTSRLRCNPKMPWRSKTTSCRHDGQRNRPPADTAADPRDCHSGLEAYSGAERRRWTSPYRSEMIIVTEGSAVTKQLTANTSCTGISPEQRYANKLELKNKILHIIQYHRRTMSQVQRWWVGGITTFWKSLPGVIPKNTANGKWINPGGDWRCT